MFSYFCLFFKYFNLFNIRIEKQLLYDYESAIIIIVHM